MLWLLLLEPLELKGGDKFANCFWVNYKKQTGTDGTYYATWTFSGQGKATTSSSGAIKAGNLVSIKPEATKYYNGVAIPAWVKKRMVRYAG